MPASHRSDTQPASPDSSAHPATCRRVLLVDDSVDTTDLIGAMLTACGHDVRAAHDGHSALRIARAFRPDVVLLDITVAPENGYEIARQLRAELGNVRLIALTAQGGASERTRARDAGFERLVLKPVRMSMLQQTVLA